MTGTAALVSLHEYEHTVYEPDVEYVDGVLVRRNVGTQLHGQLQAIIAGYLREHRKKYGISVFTETRLRIAPNRHRIPDVLVLETPYTKGGIVVEAPAIVVEIKSPDDTFDAIIDKCFEYETLTVPNILVMDPDNKRAWVFQHGDLVHFTSLNLRLPKRNAELTFQVDEMFAELDED